MANGSGAAMTGLFGKHYDYVIGIDTGTHTGYAVWSVSEHRLMRLDTLKIHEAMRAVENLAASCRTEGLSLLVRFEDARQRKYIQKLSAKQDRDRLQGVGSVKRDCSIWEDFLKALEIDYDPVPPKNNRTKLKPDFFSIIAKWNKRCSEHARDAAMLVLNFQ
ncbi:MAG: hypothetical protein HUK08_00160 [Bacteroidaceae bacterium]|nr:hypothetical protein [Bacteroidaceae bacterium]